MAAELFHMLSPAAQAVLLEGPAIRPPKGVVPDFDNPPNQRIVGWIIVPLCSAISSIAMALRLYSRVVVLKKFMIEDYVAVGALGAFIAFQYFVIRIVIYPGWFVHTWDIPLKELSGFLFNLITGATAHGIVIMLLKTAIVLDLLRIFSPRGQRGWFFWTAHVVIWTNIVFYTTCTFLELFGCQPREKLWNKLIPGGRCINTLTLNLASAAINLPSDLIILILPQRSIWTLHLSYRKRLGISAIFAVAIFACVSAGIRLEKSVPFLHDPDILYVASPFGLWIEMEMTAGFLILGVPALPKIIKSSPILRKWITIVKKWTGSSISKVKTNSKRGLPSWYKPASRKKPAREPGWSALDITEEGSVLQSLDISNNGSNDAKRFDQELVQQAPQTHPGA